MIRTLCATVFLLLVVSWNSGCQNKADDRVPTQMQAPPREPPTLGEIGSSPKQKK
jgi:hypothetical protein